MKLNIEVDSNTTPIQFSALSNLFRTLAGNAATSLISGITPAAVSGDQANQAQDEGAPPEPAVEKQPETTAPAVEAEAPKVTRRRRTRAEIEADEKLAAENSKVADAEQLAQQNNEAAVAAATETGEITGGEQDTTPAAEGDADEKAFTEGEVQALATLIARSKGPDVVRNKIVELGGTRISALTAAQINKLGAFLESQK